MTSAAEGSSGRQAPSNLYDEDSEPSRARLRIYVVGEYAARDEAELARLTARAERMQALADQLMKIKENSCGHDVGTQTDLTGSTLVGQLATAYLHGYKTGLEDR